LLQEYYSTGHNSNDNYISIISGQAPNLETQADCQIYDDFIGTGAETALDGQAIGEGCVFPTTVPSLPDQLIAQNLTWKGYMEDMGNTPSRDNTTDGDCGHPTLNSQDGTQSATAQDQYATRHNPFVYFQSVIGTPSYCNQHVVPLGNIGQAGNLATSTAFVNDLQSVATTPNFVFITPNLCHDGHDSPCADGEPGGLASINTFLQTLVPLIERSPAFQQDGLLLITFDESSGPEYDSSSCCGESAGPNTPLPGLTGLGGGLIGAVAISPQFIKPGTVSTTDYNHYSLLHTVEDLLGLNYIGYAGASGQTSFGSDVFSKAMPVFPSKSSGSSSSSGAGASSSSGSSSGSSGGSGSSSGTLPISASAP
jgi:phosphatidylinositol-3-phosphatase